ncbi:hypothetical protein N7490_006295 [Penicillium lividum]|nr:hypothetical protein N7490_006295 [Penicillium lividum]
MPRGHDQRLGLLVPPGRVRLQPSPEDGYAWSVSNSKEHLLKTCLGRGTVGLYQDIIDELGHSIEAVTPRTLQIAVVANDTTPSIEGPEHGFESFTATIQRLERDKREISLELERANARSDDLMSKNRELEATICRLEEELGCSQTSIEQMKGELQLARDAISESMKVLCKFQPNGGEYFTHMVEQV